MSLIASLSRSSSTALNVSVSPSTVTGETWGYGVCITAEPAIVEALGGIPGYTYSWARVSGSSLISATNSTNFSTYFQGVVNPGSTISAVFKCTVTDAAATVVDTSNITIDLTCNYSGGGIIP